MTSEPVRAHLWGGPRDDEVVILPPGRMTYETAPLQDFRRQGVLRGLYEARLDDSGALVPHDLESVEFDWKPLQAV